MIYFFDIPEIIDQSDLTKIPEQGQANSQEQMILKDCQELRLQFKELCSAKKLEELRKLKDSLVNYSSTVTRYLKTNVDLLAILSYKKCAHPQFKYKTFLSKETNYDTVKQSNRECAASEILMARYAYMFAIQVDCYFYLMKHRENLKLTFQDQVDPKLSSEIIKNLEYSLENMGLGYLNIKKLYAVMNDLLHFLAESTSYLQPELKATTVYSIKLILECNANNLQSEIFRLSNQWREFVEISKTSFDKLGEVQSRLLELKEEIKPEIIDFVNCAIIFYEALGCYGIMRLGTSQIKADSYVSGKNFTQTSLEVLSCSLKVLELFKYFQQEAGKKCKDEDFYQYGLDYFNNYLIPFSQQCTQKFTGIYHNKVPQVPNSRDLFFTYNSGIDYYKHMNKETKEN